MYKVVDRIRSSWEGRYIPPISTLPLYVLCGMYTQTNLCISLFYILCWYRIFRLISLCTLLWEWLAFIHTFLKQLSINLLAKAHVLFDISNIRPKYPEADFMNVHFHWGFWAYCLGFSDLRFLSGFLKPWERGFSLPGDCEQQGGNSTFVWICPKIRPLYDIHCKVTRTRTTEKTTNSLFLWQCKFCT